MNSWIFSINKQKLLFPFIVDQGTICLGLRSKRYAVLAALKRSPNELASHQRKLYKIDDHMGVGMSGLTADGRSLIKWIIRIFTLKTCYFIVISLLFHYYFIVIIILIIVILRVRYMRTEALNHKYVYGAPIQGSRLVLDLADMHQVNIKLCYVNTFLFTNLWYILL